MNNVEVKLLKKEINSLEKSISNLYVLVDTLQTNLDSCMCLLSDDDKTKIFKVPSFQWCINWKQGDEKQ